MPNQSLFGSKLKIERAKRHFRELEAVVSAFRRDNPYRLIFEDYVEGGDNRVKAVVRNVKVPPPDIAAIIGDIVHNLRSSLDLLATELARANGQTSRTALKATYFPTGADRKSFEANAADQIKRLSPAARAAILRLHPYPGGKHAAIRRLHEIDIDDKHAVLVTVAGLFLNQDFSFWVENPSDPTVKVAAAVKMHMGPQKCPLQEGDEILSFSITNDTPSHVHINPTVDVAFGQAGNILAGEPVLPTLQHFIDVTEGIVASIERDFFQ
jgi:hypothetical protein